MNTAVIAVFKNGESKEFPSIEKASKATGLSITSIKLRCNKPGTCGKDNTLFKWVSEKTRRHFQAKMNRRKGNNYELQVIKELTELGYHGLVSSRSNSKRLDNNKIDIDDTEKVMDCYIQCKATKSIPAVSTINKECGLKDRPLAIFWKKQEITNKQEEYVMIPKSYFYKLIKK